MEVGRAVSVTVASVEAAIAKRFPVARAEAWDRVGLLVGDPEREVRAVALALDPTRAAIAEAREAGANLLVTHHPAFLEPAAAIRPGPGPGGVIFSALDSGVALVNAHTNLDRDEQAQSLIPSRLGLVPVMPLERAPVAMSVVTVYVPAEAARAVTAAMIDAGAGRIGDYVGCSFSSPGTGAFTPAADARPAVGVAGEPSSADESRVEMVCPRESARSVVSAAAAAHPYEEPLVTAAEVVLARNAARLGMVCELGQGDSVTLEELAARASEAYGVTPRVWGDKGRRLTRIATATGSAGALVGDVLAAGVEVLVAGEVRYHDALEAVEGGASVVELGHDVTEWPLVELLEQVVRSVPGITPDMVVSLPATAGWWTT
jgi:putative NIF3 family GTP cyclohydrolase 1 type 2